MKLRSLFSAILVFLLSACGSGNPLTSGNPTIAPTKQPDVLYVDSSQKLGSISPYIFGSNYGPFTSIPAGKLPEALQSHISALRFPGGEFGDANDLQPYQLDSFVELCRQMGAIATISVRLLGGTPEAAAQLVRYVNIEKGYNVRYWSIGNEPDLYEGRPGVDYDTVRFNREWRAIAVAMKAVDPNIVLMGPELSGTYTSNPASNPKDTSKRDWMTEFLKANSDLVDIVTYHRYPFPTQHYSGYATIETLRQDLPEWTRTVRYLHELIRNTIGRDLPVAVTEASSDYTKIQSGEATPDSFYFAIWWADVLGRMIDENVFMVNQWMLANSSGMSGGWGLIASGGVRPAYYVYQMYNHFGTEKIYAISGIQDISTYAAKRADGTLTILVINLTDSNQRVVLQVKGSLPRQAQVWRLDATHNATDLGVQVFAEDGRLDLPMQSMTLFAIRK